MSIKDRIKEMTPNQINKIILDNLEIYSNEWGNSSAIHNKNNDYSFFERFVRTKKRILEIGSGVGFSTLKLIQMGHHVVSIEDNPFCLEKTFEKVSSASYKIEKVVRGSLNVNNTSYSVIYSKVQNELKDNNLLIEGNVIDDNELLEWLRSLEKFDAVVCWLIATHPISEIRYGYQDFQQNIYKTELLTKLLKDSSDYLDLNGYFHIVERTHYPRSEEEKELLINSYLKIVDLSKFEILDCEFRKMVGGDFQGGVRLEITNISGNDPGKIEHAFISLLLRKVITD